MRLYLFALLSCLIILCFGTSLSRDGDLWLHLSMGRWLFHQLQNGLSIYPDAFTYTGALESELFCWGSALVFYAWGIFGLPILQFALLLTGFGLAFCYFRERADFSTISFCLLACLFIHTQVHDLRPALFGEFFLILFATRIFHSLEEPPSIVLLMLASFFWINLHGSGLILLPWSLIYYAFLASQNRDWRYLGIPILIAGVLCLHPYGWEIFPRAIKLGQLAREFGVHEWSSAPFWQELLALCFVGIILRLSGSAYHKVTSLLFCALCFLSQRGLVFMWVPLLWWAPRLVPRTKWHPLYPWGAVFILCLWAPFQNRITQPQPEKAVQLLQKIGFKGNIFNYPVWGGYISYHLPESRVSVDSRALANAPFLKKLNAHKAQSGVVDLGALESEYENADAILFPSLVGVAASFPDHEIVFENNVASLAIRLGHPAIRRLREVYVQEGVPYGMEFRAEEVASVHPQWFWAHQEKPELGWFPHPKLIRQLALTDLAFFRNRGMLKLSKKG